MDCENVFIELARSVDNINTDFVEDFTRKSMEYMLSCVKANITHDRYYELLKNEWEDIIGDMIEYSKCDSNISTSKLLIKGHQIYKSESAIHDAIVDFILADDKMEVSKNAMETFKKLSTIFMEKCGCKSSNILKLILKNYGSGLKKKYANTQPDEAKKIILGKYAELMKILNEYSDPTQPVKFEQLHSNIINDISNKLVRLYSVSSVESELNKLIPNELGSLKQFFVTIITTYYNELHPIIWAQIYMKIVDNIFIDLPTTNDELFQFMSKQLLLNSGPFILKILQMVRPVLTKEIATKYNLEKLKYPLMTQKQVGIVLRNIVDDPNMFNLIANRSASVGHVCFANKVTNISDRFVIKIIKPLSIVQSCWEYKTLHKIYPKDTCENEFIMNMLKSNGREMSVLNEIENIKRGKKYYTCSYNDIFGVNYGVALKTIDSRQDVSRKNCWYAFTMTMANGVPLSELIENHLIENDTKFRSVLHRGLDLLIYKFFFNLVRNGFCHGDLHAGNIFFSYKFKELTLIDFGAVCEIDLFSHEPAMKELLDIIIMSVFNNYDDMFDKLTVLLNGKCVDVQVDMNSPEYIEFKNILRKLKINNFIKENQADILAGEYADYIFGTKRITEEQNKEEEKPVIEDGIVYDSIYSYLENKLLKEEIIVENKDILSVKFNEKENDLVTFAQVMEIMIKFYAKCGVNIATKFSQFYELQKAYSLLLGVLVNTKYNSVRTGIMIKRAIKTLKHLPKLAEELPITKNIISTYISERGKKKEFIKKYFAEN